MGLKQVKLVQKPVVQISSWRQPPTDPQPGALLRVGLGVKHLARGGSGRWTRLGDGASSGLRQDELQVWSDDGTSRGIGQRPDGVGDGGG